MIPIVIADDEKLIRAGIRKILESNFGETIKVHEAKNGKEALELCKTENPYVLVTDIRMPIMDGVELMGNIKTLEKKPSIIVLSGFDDFNYAKAAIANGAFAYLLKPVDTKELLESVNNALQQAQKIEKQKKEENLRSIISTGYAESKNSSVDFESGVRCITVSSTKDIKGEDILKDIPYSYILEQKRGAVNLLVPTSHIHDIENNEELSKYTIGVSDETKNPNDLRRLTSHAYRATFKSFFTSKDCKKKTGIYYYVPTEVSIDFANTDLLYEKTISALELFSDEAVSKALDSLFDFEVYDDNIKFQQLYYIYGKITDNLFKRYPKFTENDTYLYSKSLMIENIDLTSSLGEWKHYILDYLLYLSQLIHSQQGKYPYITKALEYIAKHYSEGITMATVANEVSVNYTWFSEKFKEQAGTNFNDYLKKYRMEKAKQLLAMGTYKVYEVAQKTGFKEVKHFMKCFREMNGMSAGEWARTHTN